MCDRVTRGSLLCQVRLVGSWFPAVSSFPFQYLHAAQLSLPFRNSPYDAAAPSRLCRGAKAQPGSSCTKRTQISARRSVGRLSRYCDSVLDFRGLQILVRYATNDGVQPRATELQLLQPGGERFARLRWRNENCGDNSFGYASEAPNSVGFGFVLWVRFARWGASVYYLLVLFWRDKRDAASANIDS